MYCLMNVPPVLMRLGHCIDLVGQGAVLVHARANIQAVSPVLLVIVSTHAWQCPSSHSVLMQYYTDQVAVGRRSLLGYI